MVALRMSLANLKRELEFVIECILTLFPVILLNFLFVEIINTPL